jgi:uncharacterized protein YfbU (UPF0304 family)
MVNVLDSENANYSYGSLQRILRLGWIRKIAVMKFLFWELVADVIKTLVDEIKFKGSITGLKLIPKL